MKQHEKYANGCVSDCGGAQRAAAPITRRGTWCKSGEFVSELNSKSRRKFVLLESPRKHPTNPRQTQPWQQIHSTVRGHVAQKSIVAWSLKSTALVPGVGVGGPPPDRDTSNKNQRDMVGTEATRRGSVGWRRNGGETRIMSPLGQNCAEPK
jgi:hypothetical protein